jgi:YHS domain-containing protein
MKKQIVFLLFLSIGAFAQNTALRQKHFFVEHNTALQGYDAVSYFSKKPVKGKVDFSTVYQGIKYQFASASNLETFKKTPDRYEPQYGGWCAYAMGEKGEKVEVDPETFKIIDGKLYLFYNQFFNNTLTDWNKNESQLKQKADTNWQKTVQ